MNTKIIILTFVPFIVFQSCESRLDNNVKSASDERERSIIFRRIDLLKNEKLIRALDEYFYALRKRSYWGTIPEVYQLVLEPNGFETSFRITGIKLYSEFIFNIPSGYFKLDNKIILVYTGLEGLSPIDSTFFKKLDPLVRDKLIKDVDHDGNFNDTIQISLWHPKAWQFKIIDKDSIEVDTHVKSPNLIKEVSPPKEVLEFIKN